MEAERMEIARPAKIISRVEIIPVAEVAAALGIAPMKVKSAIKNGTMPIGCVCKDEENSTHERTVIIKRRWEKWIAGEL